MDHLRHQKYKSEQCLNNSRKKKILKVKNSLLELEKDF